MVEKLLKKVKEKDDSQTMGCIPRFSIKNRGGKIAKGVRKICQKRGKLQKKKIRRCEK
jgi:hypothetical protein